MKRLYFFAIIISFLHLALSPLSAQRYHNDQDFAFLNQTASLLPTNGFKSDLIIAIADMNGDDLDDIVRLRDGIRIEILVQRNGLPFEMVYTKTIAEFRQLGIAIADVDVNGYNDILVGGLNDELKLLYNMGNNNIVESTLENSTFFVQGLNFIDINGDAVLDAFVCNDEGASRIYVNDGTGKLLYSDKVIDMDIYDPPFNNGGNYSSVWTDVDNDGDMDLYLSKCYRDALPDDPRRKNQLFINNGNNQFVEAAEEAGLAVTHQSWTSDFQDIDNDGDLDCLIVNHYAPCQLFENDGQGHFTEITEESELIVYTEAIWQGMMRDFDNDGWVDVMFSSTYGSRFFRNMGNKKFVEVIDLFDDHNISSFAVGDANRDGLLDIYSSTNDQTTPDALWVNTTLENNYLGITLEGTISNRDAIGARIELHGDWGIQVREVRSGEGYGIMNGYTRIFGLGQYEEVDRLVVHWPAPSNRVDTYENIRANQYLHLVENKCIYPDRHIKVNGPMVFCEGEESELIAPLGESYLWSTGEQSSSIKVTASGEYQVMVINKWGCEMQSEVISIEVNPDETPIILYNGAPVSDSLSLCGGLFAQLDAEVVGDYLWSNGNTGPTIFVSQPGTYTLSTQGLCESFTSAELVVEVVDLPPDPIAFNDTVPQPGGFVTLTAQGDQLRWTNSNYQVMGYGQEFEVAVSETTEFFVEEFNLHHGDTCFSNRIPAVAVVKVIVSTEDLEGQQSDFSLFPNPASHSCVIKSQADYTGMIQLIIYNSKGQRVYQQDVVHNQGPIRENIDLSNLANGVYVVQIQTDQSNHYTRLIRH
ncbi:MAG: FG-GAP-like repeat-containing protein [Bacteroidota bacterium]